MVALIRHVEEVEQKHDALDDAMLLKECYEGLNTLDKDTFMSEITPVKQAEITKCNTAFQKAYDKLITDNGKLEPVKMPEHIFSTTDRDYLFDLRRNVWLGLKPENISGDGSSEYWNVKLTHIRTGDVKYFTRPWVAAMFLNAYVLKSRSSKDFKTLNVTMKEMAKNPNNFAGYRCEIKFKKPIETDI